MVIKQESVADWKSDSEKIKNYVNFSLSNFNNRRYKTVSKGERKTISEFYKVFIG